MKITRLMLLAAALIAALAVAGCSSDDQDEQSATSAPVSSQSDETVTTSESAAPDSETALRAKLDEFYQTVMQHQQLNKAWDYISPRCQAMVDRDTMTNSMTSAYGPDSGRDFSDQPEYLITMGDRTAKVVQRSADGKGSMQPQNWSLIDGEWMLDYC